MKLLPEKMLRCVSAEDRKKLGKAGLTAQEALAKCEAKTERELQRQIISLLRLKGIEVNVSRMDKRKTDKVGWPDLTFAVDIGLKQRYPFCAGDPTMPNAALNMLRPVLACAWEIKLPGGKLSSGQSQLSTKLIDNGWRFRVIRSVDDAIKELRGMGIY